MSYTIVYDRQFVKLPDNRIIPLALYGCSNVTEPHWVGAKCYERRAREWNPMYTQDHRVAWTAEELMDYVHSFLPSAYGEHFKYNSNWVDDEGLVRFIKTGIKHAKTIEELKELSYSPDRVYLQCKVMIVKYTNNHYFHNSEDYCIVNTSQELAMFLERAYLRCLSKLSDETNVYVSIAFPHDVAVPSPKARIERKNARAEKTFQLIESGHYFVLRCNKGWYFRRRTRNGVKGYSSACAARPFATASDAERYLSQNLGPMTINGLEWTVVEINNTSKQTM